MIAFAGYQRDSYILKAKVPRFGSGEAKGMILESVRGTDLYLLVDVANYSLLIALLVDVYAGTITVLGAFSLLAGSINNYRSRTWFSRDI